MVNINEVLYGEKIRSMDSKEKTWIITYTGKKFSLIDPTPEMIDPVDIAHALSHLCRWVGHTKGFYSVAEHCIHCKYLAEIQKDFLHFSQYDFLCILLHDAHEAYIGDISVVLKDHLNTGTRKWKEIEEKIDLAIAKRFGLSEEWNKNPHIKEIDRALLYWESKEIIHPNVFESSYLKELEDMYNHFPFEKIPLNTQILLLPEEAKEGWLEEFKKLNETQSKAQSN